MDFARKQLEKYGWTDGKGLGKNENGIAEALKPKLKRSVTGIGHDAASDFTEHWWTQLYNKAASNVEVKEKNGQTKKIKTKDTDEFEITNSTWKIKKKKKKTDKEEQYKDFFVRKAVLNNGEGELEKTENASDSDSDGDNVNKDVFKMTDEELFAACEGRTAHKGARHGLKATGKLARIAQQEQLLLTQSQYEGYSHAKRRKAEENLQNDLTNNSDDIKDSSGSKKEKKKKKKNSDQAESVTSLPDGYEKKISDSVASNDEKDVSSRKSSKLEDSEIVESVNDESVITKKKKKKRETEDLPEAVNNEEEIVETLTETKSKKKKKKHKHTSE